VHSERYIRELAQQHKLNVAYMKQAVLRTEHEQPVQGLIAVLQK
jgi:predicted TPR repeat methyltransferase